MYDIIVYEDLNDKSEISEYLQNLKSKSNKDSRIKFKKITTYIELLAKERISIK